MLKWLWGLISRTPPRPASTPGKLAVEKPDRHDLNHTCGAAPYHRKIGVALLRGLRGESERAGVSMALGPLSGPRPDAKRTRRKMALGP